MNDLHSTLARLAHHGRRGSMRIFSLCAVTGALVLAAAANAAVPEFDSAQGAGSIAPNSCVLADPAPVVSGTTFCLTQGREFSFSAKQRGFGERATGFYTQRNLLNPGPGIRGEVTCLNVLGEFAVFGGIVRQSASTSLIGLPFVVYVVDNGPPGSSPPDLISPLGTFPQNDPDRPLLPEAFPNICPPPFPSLYGYFAVDTGDIVVEDESASDTVVGP